ncbi:dihydroorotate dehydrogenase B catalytic subunit [Nocardiopsis sp. CNR-923]|uniref:dihydroorotate dehydrogenase n=1 Tax=Nocardiopsis sp. CNR-923 TaxID=1904965 RepID=UPI000967868A|nr:dihydroorotate dehydrogenase [Nocardiopsis sp. CNR-923]OLT30118.1 dihydroorotate dehydrogenase B catalytic subunit [Nocardiopsis sp. CNR-923]
MNADLTIRLGGAELPNPVVTAAGCAGAGRELARFFDVSSIGAVTTKSVMLEPHAGRPAPRMAETPSGMLNTVGMQGPGIDVFLQRDLPWLLSRGARAIVSIAGTGTAEFGELARRVSGAAGVSAIEVNLSCPDPADPGGRYFADDPASAAAVVGTVRSHARSDVPVLAKLAADVPDVVELASACVEARADGLSMINTVRGMAIDTRTLRPAVAGGVGGLSGPAIRPLAVGCVFRVHEALPDVPIVGMGGVRTGADVVEFMAAGASAVAVGTTNFSDPSACARVLRQFTEELEARGIERARDLVGAAHGEGVGA